MFVGLTPRWENTLITVLPPCLPQDQILWPLIHFTMDKITRPEWPCAPPPTHSFDLSTPDGVKTWIFDYSITSFPVSWFGFQSAPICYRLSLNQKGTFRSLSLQLEGSGHLSNYLAKDAHEHTWSRVGVEAKSTHRGVHLAQAVILKNQNFRTLLVIQSLRLHAANAGGTGLIPARRSHMLQSSARKVWMTCHIKKKKSRRSHIKTV